MMLLLKLRKAYKSVIMVSSGLLGVLLAIESLLPDFYAYIPDMLEEPIRATLVAAILWARVFKPNGPLENK